MHPFDLSPWDMLGYFATVTETVVVGVFGVKTSLCLPNNTRVGLLISPANAGTSIISTSPDPTLTTGYNISTNLSSVYFSTKTHGPLSTMQWYAITPTTYIVFEIVVSRWPTEGDSHLSAIEHPTPAVQRTILNTRPGVDDKQGIVSYWQSILDKIRGK